jgi:hypothetical protein
MPATARYYPSASETGEEPEDDESIGNAEARVEIVEDNEATENEEEENNPIDPEAPSAECQKTLDDELTDTAESSPSDRYDNDANRVLFVGAAPEASTV